MNSSAVQVLDDGRVFVDYGPVTMVILASKKGQIQTDLCLGCAELIQNILKRISKDLKTLSRFPTLINTEGLSGIALDMVLTVNQVKEPTLTPMATVAGTLSDYIADWLFEQDVDKVVVNNGGDIALRLRGDQRVRMGILPNVNTGKLAGTVTITAEDGIGGVATSGFGGRSFTRGIANAVTVFSSRCMIADACATHIANASYISSPQVERELAGELMANCDIADLEVVTKVGSLSDEEIKKSINQIKMECERQARLGNIKFAFADVCGVHLNWPDGRCVEEKE